jgi:hypothetical protein
MWLALACLLLLVAARVGAQERPSEEDLFGGPQKPEPPPAQGAPPPPEPPAPAEAQEDPLKIGGQLYLRSVTQWVESVRPSDWILTAPALVDGYFDVRPNDRVRGFLLARLQYDLARAQTSAQALPATAAGAPGSPSGSGTLTSVFQSDNPRMVLDQLWLRFDVERTVFVTAGKQHVKWGAAHFWNPTDFLHPVPRDPLAVFDARTGLTMVKLHLPWERTGWNFYAVGFVPEQQASPTLGQAGGAARAEIVLGKSEIGLDAVVQRDRNARVGVDASAGIGDFDVYVEAALRYGSDLPLYRKVPSPPPGTGLLGQYEPYAPQDFRPSVATGATWSWKYSDQDTLTVGAEYFYNANGYDDPAVYPVLIAQELLQGQAFYTPFYLGRHYAGTYLLLPNPGSWNNTSFTLSTVGNLSDRTFVTRLDVSQLLLTYLRLEAFAAVHYGVKGGEFRLGFQLDPSQVPPGAPTVIPAPLLDLGVALRVSL